MKSDWSHAAERIAADCLAVRLRILNRVITAIYDEALRPFGVRVTQLNILVVAARLGVASPSLVCERLALDPSTLSRNVARMRAQGWIENVADQDGRAALFQVSNTGRELIRRVAPAWEQAQEAAARRLESAGVTFLRRFTEQVWSSPG